MSKTCEQIYDELLANLPGTLHILGPGMKSVLWSVSKQMADLWEEIDRAVANLPATPTATPTEAPPDRIGGEE